MRGSLNWTRSDPSTLAGRLPRAPYEDLPHDLYATERSRPSGCERYAFSEHNLCSRTRHVGNDPRIDRYDPDLGPDEFAFLNQPGQADVQSDLFYDYRTNVGAYPKWQAWMREKQPRLLVIWGRYDLSFELSEPDRYRRDVPNALVHVLDAGHFALDTAADQIADLVRGFVASPR